MMKNPLLLVELFDHRWVCGPFHSCSILKWNKTSNTQHQKLLKLSLSVKKHKGLVKNLLDVKYSMLRLTIIFLRKKCKHQHRSVGCPHLHINLLTKVRRLAKQVQILKRRNWVMAIMKLVRIERRNKHSFLFSDTCQQLHLGLLVKEKYSYY